nr:ATP-binding cassette domain-containing protein [Candidatus Delongbacteria bacterium]
MNETMLNAILNLFSLQAALMEPAMRGRAREILEHYLIGYLRIVRPDIYLQIFDAALELQQETGRDQLLERSREISSKLKSILPRFEQYGFLLRCLDLAVAVGASEQAMQPVETVAAELGIDSAVFHDLAVFSHNVVDHGRLSERFVLAGQINEITECRCVVLSRPEFRGRLCGLMIAEVGALFIVTDQPDLSLDSIPLEPFKRVLLQPGSIIRDGLGNRIYQAELEALFLKKQDYPVIQFRGECLEFSYPGSDNGLHNFSFSESSGRMVGIMGASGSGKSTLLSILTGQLKPDSGRILINGLDVYQDSNRLQGVIGLVPQDDLLFEELTVFDNLMTAAGLCLANLSREERVRQVESILDELHQPEIRDLKVGSPLEKTISGGQRKRLNIALELIREPSILFVDEPTSGLSSADSENVMSLLKAQAAKGKLVLVVIHQPSSRIYKMFDSLWIMDQGGRPIWAGNPLDAIVHFRTEVHQAAMDEYACPHCGNVNPEQLFEIIEAREIDENGHYTGARRVSAETWHQRYLQMGMNMESRSDETMAPIGDSGIGDTGIKADSEDFGVSL